MIFTNTLKKLYFINETIIFQFHPFLIKKFYKLEELNEDENEENKGRLNQEEFFLIIFIVFR